MENIIDAIGDIAREKGIPRERLIEVIQEAITAAAKRKFRDFEDIETRLNESTGGIEVFRYKRVAEQVTDPRNEISLEEARQLDSLAEEGDEVEYEIDNQELSRVIAQTARQLIFQKVREAERETIYENFKDRRGEILNGMVVRTERNRAVLSFNNTEAILYGREQMPNERLSPGEHVRVILLDVLNDPKEASQLVISRTHPMLLTKLFEMEVPEIYDGIVEIVAAAREPGRRAKIAVRSNDPDVDPVGACVGMRGSRVQAIISELRGEKIDIIKWSDDLPTYVANALAPAELSRIKIDSEAMQIDAEVEPDQLSLAIGRQGQNVRLASKLTGYKINVSSTQEQGLSLEEQIRERLLASQAALEGAAAGRESGIESGSASTEGLPEWRPPGEEGAPAEGAAAAPEGEEAAAEAAEPGAEAPAEAAAPAEPAPEDSGVRPAPPVEDSGVRPAPPVEDSGVRPAPPVPPAEPEAEAETAAEPGPAAEAAAEPEPATEEGAEPEPAAEDASEPEPAAEEASEPESRREAAPEGEAAPESEEEVPEPAQPGNDPDDPNERSEAT